MEIQTLKEITDIIRSLRFAGDDLEYQVSDIESGERVEFDRDTVAEIAWVLREHAKSLTAYTR